MGKESISLQQILYTAQQILMPQACRLQISLGRQETQLVASQGQKDESLTYLVSRDTEQLHI